MPWKCPACGEPIQHSGVELMPRKGVRYRCHICRLELQYDDVAGKMTLAPIATVDTDPRDRFRK